MATVTYAPGIQYVNGALSKPKKVDGHKHGDYLIATHRTAATTNPNCTRLYVRKADAYQRSTPVTQDELAARNHFKQVAQAVVARTKNLGTIATDIANFNAQKDNDNGYKTLRQYLWHICAAEING